MTQEQKFLHISQSIPDPGDITDFELHFNSVHFEWKDHWYRAEKDGPGEFTVDEIVRKDPNGKLKKSPSARLIESHLNF